MKATFAVLAVLAALTGCGRGTWFGEATNARAPLVTQRDAAERGPATALEESATEGWHRVGHRSVQPPAISDGAARPHAYFSVVAFDSGEVVPLNSWYHPQLFDYARESSALVSRAFMFPHEGMGNEDDIRWRIRAHEGPTAAESLVFWHVMGWEEITDENGSLARDAAVFSTRPIEASPGVMPAANARVVNLGADARRTGIGPYRAGVDYDQPNHILFVSMDGSDESVGRTLFQALSVDLASGRFEGRAVVAAPGPSYRQAETFLRVDPAHGLVLTLAENRWERDRSILYLATYAPDGEVATFGPVQQLEGEELASADVASIPIEARDAAFVERGGHVWAVLAAHGLFVLDLGPIGGPYVLRAPVAHVPTAFRAEAIELVGDELIVSSHGLEAYPASAVIDARGEQSVASAIVRLPYPTYDFDVANIDGAQTLFVASGGEGLEIFERDAESWTGSLARESRSVSIRTGNAEILLETGDGLRTIDAPVSNTDGDLAFWAVTGGGHEAIVLLEGDSAPVIVADTGRDGYRALGRPSLAAAGHVAFWAARDDGSQSIVEWDGALTELARTDDNTIAFERPELADNGALLFGRYAADGTGSLVVRRTDGSLVTVFTDDADWMLDAEEGEPTAPYDISPSGEAVFVQRNRENRDLRLVWWNGERTFEVGSDDREVGFARMVTPGIASYRGWGGEVIKLRVVRANESGEPGEPETIADRRSIYGDYMFGNFETAAALGADDVYFIAQKWVHGSLEPSELGSSLHRFTNAESLPGTLVATADSVDGAIVRNVLFADAATSQTGAAFVLELERDGNPTYALTRITP